MNSAWMPDQLPTLATGDVIPLPLCIETNWANDGWEVNVLLVSDVTPNGYESYPVWTRREPYAQQGERAGTDPDEADRVLDHGLQRFAERLREVLTDTR